MRTAALIAFLLAMTLPSRILAADAGYDVQVVVAVKGLDDEALARLAKEPSVSIEYSCVWSGVVVLKYLGVPSGDRADAITMARRSFASAGIDQGVEVLHVHVEATGPGKC